MNIYSDMGIQRWRLKSTAVNTMTLATQATVSESSEDSRNSLSDVVVEPPEVAPVGSNLEQNADLDWQGLQALIDDEHYCPSCHRDNSILGGGDTNADWMFITDAPSSNDIQQQQLFTGRAGKLYEAMLQALKVDRSQVYTCSVFKCAPTDDLSQSPLCNKLLQRQIELVQPKVVVALGEFTAQAVIKANEALSVLREGVQQCFTTGVGIIPTYSPAQMLDDSSLKAHVWADLKKALVAVQG